MGDLIREFERENASEAESLKAIRRHRNRRRTWRHAIRVTRIKVNLLWLLALAVSVIGWVVLHDPSLVVLTGIGLVILTREI